MMTEEEVDVEVAVVGVVVDGAVVDGGVVAEMVA